MFRSARWRSEKSKIKAVFKFHFHATQVLQLENADALVVSVVPRDVGKPTARLEKCVVQEGSCRWEKSVCETVSFVRDAKTGKINDKVYHFVVSTGSLKSSLIGEVSINLAEYAEAIKASTVSLPLNNSKSNMTLHVSIQRVQENADKQDVEENEDVLVSQNRTRDTSTIGGDSDQGAVHAVLPGNSVTENTKINGTRIVSSGSDITMSSSGSSSELSTPLEVGFQDPAHFQSIRSNLSVPRNPTAVYGHNKQSKRESLTDSDLGLMADEATNGSQGMLTREYSQKDSDVEIEKLKAEIVVLSGQANVSELELQTLRKQIVKESKKGQDLTKEVTGLKEERDALREECEKLKVIQKRMEEEAKSKFKLHLESGDPRFLLKEIRQELNHEKDLNVNLRLQLQKTQESNEELILAVKDLEEMLDQKNKEAHDNANKSRNDTDDDEEQKALEELVKEHKDTQETYVLEQKVMDLYSEVEICHREKDDIEMQMEQLALDYEILKQQNHDMLLKLQQCQLHEQLKMQFEGSSCLLNVDELEARIESLENELKKQSKEYSDSLSTINELKICIRSLEEDLASQAQAFEGDIEALIQEKVEQEKRAIHAEEALRNTKWKNANTAEKLMEDFNRLSADMASAFESNEKVAVKAFAEANELRMRKCQVEQMLSKLNEELQLVKDGYEIKLQELTNQLTSKTDLIEQMLVEITSKPRQHEDQKVREEVFVTEEVQRLKAEIEGLAASNDILSEEVKERDARIGELEESRNELTVRLASVKKEGEGALEELNRIRYLKDEKEAEISLLQSEMEALRTQCNDLKIAASENESEKEQLQKQVVQLKGDLKKKEDAFKCVEKKLKENNKRAVVPDVAKSNPRNNKSAPSPHGPREVVELREKIKLLEGQIKLKEAALEASSDSFSEKERSLRIKIEELESKVDELNQNCLVDAENDADILSELVTLKERNKSMETELKEMQERYSEISLKFAEVENERQRLMMTVRNLKSSRRS